MNIHLAPLLKAVEPLWKQIKILFAGININNLIKYGDYRRFETEVKDAKVGDDK